jgi:hypothetical protein
MSTQSNTTVQQPRPEDLRAVAQRLLLDGMSGRDIATALNLDLDTLRRLLGVCLDC